MKIFFFALILQFGTTASIVWAACSFIIYLVKDKPFNFCSLYTLIFCFIASMCLIVFSAAKIKDKF